MKVSVFGVGYVGLVQGAILADVGHHVVCIDINKERIQNLEKGILPIYEPGLKEIVLHNIKEGRLQFSTDPESGVAHGEILFIAVGTPPDEDGSADLKYVLEVASTISRHMAGYKIVVNKSTVPVGTANKVQHAISQGLAERNAEIGFDVVSNPEFLKEGAAVADCQRPDRIVVGTKSEKARAKMRELYAPFNRNHEKIIFMDERSAELTKYAANCMLATKISFMNEMASLAEQLGADIESVRHGIGSDARIGYHFIYPGCGYGGSCFPKDVSALIRTASSIGHQSVLLQSVETVNERQKHTLFEKIKSHLGSLEGKKVALWGLSFKPNTDDMREAPSRVLMEKLWQEGAYVQAYDPEAMQETTRIYGAHPQLTLCDSPDDVLEGADILVICTEWKVFRAPDFDKLAEKLKYKAIFDGRNIYTPEMVESHGLAYFGIGRGRSIKQYD